MLFGMRLEGFNYTIDKIDRMMVNGLATLLATGR